MSKKTSMSQPLAPAMTVMDANNLPLVEPSTVEAGEKPTAASKALSALAVSAGLTDVINRRAAEDTNRLAHKALVSQTIAEYWQTIEETKDGAKAGTEAQKAVENATSNVSKALADAILADAMSRKEARQFMGQSFGFVESPKTGKPTSKPNEPGNTIAKRVSSVTIAAEYAITGQLPDRGGDNLPLVGQDEVQRLLGDYFAGEITVRAASERIEAAIREARVNVPLEMNADKLLALAGKIQTASEAIAKNDELKEAYAALLQVIAAVPFQ